MHKMFKIHFGFFFVLFVCTNPSTRHQLGSFGQGLEKLEKFLHKTGTVGYAVGNTHTIADIHLLAHITFMGSGFWDGIPADYANRFTRITSIRQNMASHGSIKAYYESKATKNNYDDLYITARDLPTGGACEQQDQVRPKPNGCLKDLYSKVGRTTKKCL